MARKPAKTRISSPEVLAERKAITRTRKPADGVKRPHGGQTIYTREIADEICRRLSLGETLPAICKTPGMPDRVTVMGWADENRDGFCDRYLLARERQRDAWADDIVAIADDSTQDAIEKEGKNGETFTAANREFIERSKVRIQTRQWLMKVGSPRKYGDKVETTHNASAAFVDLLKMVSENKTVSAS